MIFFTQDLSMKGGELLKASMRLKACAMLLTISLPLILSSGKDSYAAITEAGGNDFCYAGDSNSGGDDGTGVAPKDKVDTIPITVPDESKTGKAAMKEIADAIGEKLNILPALVYAQMCQEAGPNGDSQEAVNDKNFSGIKGSGGGIPSDGTGGQYQKFDSLSDYASRFAAILKNDGLSGTQDPTDYVHKLKMMHYFTASEESYLAGVKALMAGYYGSDANGASTAAGASGENDASAKGSWHKGDESFAPDSLDTTFTTGFGGGEEQQAEDNENAAASDQVSGDWKDKNSQAFKEAKSIFEFLTKKMGFSGAGAAGALGNLAIESSFNPKASNGTHFGWVQWDQSRLNAGNMKGYDSTTLTADNEMKLMQTELNGKYKDVKDKVGNSTDVTEATGYWNDHYEVSGDHSGKREAAAQWFYQQLDGASISADSSLLGAADAANAGMDAAADDSSSKNSGACNNGNGDSDAASGGWGWPFKDVPKNGPTSWEDGQQYGITSLPRGRTNFHDGFDFGSAKYHGDILAVHNGKVYKEGVGDGMYYIWVKSSDGYNEIYQEFTNSTSDFKVHEGDEVHVGQPIAHLSSSHLHLGITNKPITQFDFEGYDHPDVWPDPIKVIKGENTDQK